MSTFWPGELNICEKCACSLQYMVGIFLLERGIAFRLLAFTATLKLTQFIKWYTYFPLDAAPPPAVF